MATKKSTRRSVARQAAAAAEEDEDIIFQDPLPSLGEDRPPKVSFHVKPDATRTGQGLEKLAKRMSENNRVVSENLIDIIRVLCDEGTLDRLEWAESLVALGRLVDGTE